MESAIENEKYPLEERNDMFEMVFDWQDYFPEFLLVLHLMVAHENAISNRLGHAMDSINKAEESLADIKEKGLLKNVENVLDRLFLATKCHVLLKLKRSVEVDELLDQIHRHGDIEMDEIESAMLYGCKCIAWLGILRTEVIDFLLTVKVQDMIIQSHHFDLLRENILHEALVMWYTIQQKKNHLHGA